MKYARTRFWIAFAAAASLWLAMLFFGGPEQAWDRSLLGDLHAGADPGLARAAALLTHLGGWIFLSIIGLAAFVALAFKRRRRAALLLFTLFGGRMLVELHKLLLSGPRPPAADHLVKIDESLGFPSAHAANSMITYVAIALLVPVAQRRRAISVTIGVALAIAIGISRVVLGVHWPSDVVGGWAFGLLWIIICIRLASVRPDAELPAEER